MKQPKFKHTIGCLLVAAIGLFASFHFLRAVTRALESPTHNRDMANGMGIYKSLFAVIYDIKGELYGGETVELPNSKQSGATERVFLNSTDYLVHLVKKDIIPVNWSYFTGISMQPAQGRFLEDDPSSVLLFKPENNMWCVVADLNPNDPNAPLLISRNLDATKLEKLGRPELDTSVYDQKYVLIIRMNGAREYLEKKRITWENINPGGLDNVILRP